MLYGANNNIAGSLDTEFDVDVATVIRKYVSSGKTAGRVLFAGSTGNTGMPPGKKNGAILFYTYKGTGSIYLTYNQYDSTPIYGRLDADATVPVWDPYVTNSDLGKVISASGTVKAVKGQINKICSVTLPAGHKYLLLGSTGTTISVSSLMSAETRKISGNSSTIGPQTTRGTMDSGGGLVIWDYVETVTECVFYLGGYGYSSAEYNYTGIFIAIQLA